MPITYFVAFLLSLSVGCGLTLTMRHAALRFGWMDRVKTSRNVHTSPIPRLGGLGIVGGFFAPLTALLVVDSSVGLTFRAAPQLVVSLFVGGVTIAVLGLYDDLRGAGAPLKFGVQIAVAVMLYALGLRIEILANPFGPPLTLGAFSPVLTIFWMVGVVNAMNLIDGLDGLAGGVAFFAVATNFVLAATRGDILMCLLMAALAGAILGFLVFNFNPASIFMGDTGSMFLGFVLAAASIKTSTKSGTAVAMLVPIIALGLPIMDTLLAMVRRTLLGRPMFSADKEHIHHRLMSRMLLSHRKAVLVLYGLCCLFMLTALGLSFANSAQSAMLLAAIGIIVVVLMRKLGYLNLHSATAVGVVRRKNIELRSVIRELSSEIRAASSYEAIWNAIAPLTSLLEASKLLLHFDEPSDGTRSGVTYLAERMAGGALPINVRIELESSSPIGALEMSWRDGRGEVNRDEELALEVIADTIVETVSTIRARRAAPVDKVLRLSK